MSDRTYQQTLVMTRMQDTYNATIEANRRVESRASLVIAASSAVVGLVASVHFLPENVQDAHFIVKVFLGSVCLSAIGVFFIGSRVFTPASRSLAGTIVVENLYANFIDVSEEKAFRHALMDLSEATRKAMEANTRKARWVDLMMRAFEAQLFFLAGAIVCR